MNGQMGEILTEWGWREAGDGPETTEMQERPTIAEAPNDDSRTLHDEFQLATWFQGKGEPLQEFQDRCESW